MPPISPGASQSEVRKKLYLRGLGERTESAIQRIEPMEDYRDLMDEQFLDKLPEILHAACFIGFIAINAGKMDNNGMLGDKGILH